VHAPCRAHQSLMRKKQHKIMSDTEDDNNFKHSHVPTGLSLSTAAASSSLPSITMGELDPYDRLNQACRESQKYPDPCTILKRTHPKQALQTYCEYLDKNEDDLFEDAHKAQLLFSELPPGERSTPMYPDDQFFLLFLSFFFFLFRFKVLPNSFLLLTLHEPPKGFLATKVRDKKSLEGHLLRGQKDPRCRHVLVPLSLSLSLSLR